MKSVSVIIPTVNEGATIAKVIKDVKSHLSYDFEILVVDYKSSDKTAEIANANGARAINVDEKGKGRAVKKGAEKASGEVVVVLDGDASFSAEKIDEIVGPVFNNEKDIVYGSRFYLVLNERCLSFAFLVTNSLFG